MTNLATNNVDTGSDAPAARRILVLTSSARRRGAEIEAGQLAAQLCAHGWQADIAALSPSSSGIRLDVDVLGERRLGVATLRELRRRAHSYDVVIAYGSSTLPACVLALPRTGVPFVYRSISDPARWLRGPIHKFVTRLQYRRAQMVVALWSGAADTAVDVLGVQRGRTAVVPNARDSDQYRPPSVQQRTAARERYGVGTSRVVTFVGAASPEKRLDLAIDTVALLPDHVLLVAGGGTGLDEAQRYGREILGARSIFVGEVDDVVPVLHASDVVLITSDVEGMPGVAIEAALSGVSVVGTDAGALWEMPFVGCAERNAADLARAVLAVEPPAPSSASAYTWPEVVPSWIEILNRVADGQSESLGLRLKRSIRPRWRRFVARVRPSTGVISRVHTSAPVFALTFDDGPDDVWTPRLLDLLRSHGARATFFVLGERVAGREELLDRMRADGHCVATHGWDHLSLVADAAPDEPNWYRTQIELGAAPLQPRPTLFRAAFGHLDRRSRRAANDAGLDAVGWDIDPRDYLGLDADKLARRVTAELRPGSIVLLHDRLHSGHDPAYFDRAPTIDAVRTVLEEVAGRMECVTVPELLARGRATRRPTKSPPTGWTTPPFVETDLGTGDPR